MYPTECMLLVNKKFVFEVYQVVNMSVSVSLVLHWCQPLSPENPYY